MIERTIIKNSMVELQVKEYLKEKYKRAQISFVDVQRTPLNTRVIVYCGNPKVLIGRGGKTIEAITTKLEKDFQLFKPYIDVRYVENPWLDAAIVARRICEEIERGKRHAAVAQKYMRKIMDSGAYGVEIRISGKLSGERSRSEMFRAGYIKKCGNPSKENIDSAKDYVVLKPGKIGVKVSIMVSLPEVALLEKNIKGNEEKNIKNDVSSAENNKQEDENKQEEITKNNENAEEKSER